MLAKTIFPGLSWRTGLIPRPILTRTKLYSPKTSSMTGDIRKEAVTRAAARIMKVRAPLVTMAVAVFLFCLSMSP